MGGWVLAFELPSPPPRIVCLGGWLSNDSCVCVFVSFSVCGGLVCVGGFSVCMGGGGELVCVCLMCVCVFNVCVCVCVCVCVWV